MKKFISLLLFFEFASTLLFSQTAWVQRADFPGCPRYAAGGFTIGNKIYIVGGWCPSGAPDYQRDVWEYDTDADSWTRRDSLIYGLIYPGSFAINGKGYIIGGGTDSLGIRGMTYYTRVWEYDTATTHWLLKNYYPYPQYPSLYNELSFAVDTAGYTLVIGNPYVLNYIRYSQQNDSWSGFPADSTVTWQIHSLAGGSVCVHNHLAYLFAGNATHNYMQNEILIFNPMNNFWDSQHVFPFYNYGIDSTYSGNFLFYKDSVLYFGLGTNMPYAEIGTYGGAYTYFNNIYSYNLRNDSVIRYPNFPYGPSAGSNYFEVNGRYFLVCGDGGMTGNKVVEFFPDSLILSLNTDRNTNPEINLIPNPSTNEVRISSNGKKIKAVEIFDINGKPFQTNFLAKNADAILELKEFDSGIYILKITMSEDVIVFKKIIKI